MAAAKKPVKSRLVFTREMPGEERFLDVTSTFNMTERSFLDRDPDMQVEDADGIRRRIVKSFIAEIKEIQVVEQVVEEV